MDTFQRDITQSLVAAAREINSARSLSSTLDAIVSSARSSLPGVDHVGVSIAHRRKGPEKGRIETMAATDPLVYELDSIQYELGEGPCVYAIEHEPVTVVENVRHEQRWPRYVPLAVQRGLLAQIGLRLYLDDRTLGGLNLYSVKAETFEPGTVETAELFAAHVAGALGRARETDELNTALATRSDIGKAIGILMVRYRLSDERAFEYLVRVSSHTNTKIRDVAAEVVSQQKDDAAQQGP